MKTRALLFALFLGACAVPEIDQRGRVRCGAAGCPNEMECHFGHCCPPNSGAMCPSVENIESNTDGTRYACDAVGACPGNYECHFGVCCPPTGGTGRCAAGVLGAPCEANEACSAPEGPNVTIGQTAQCFLQGSPGGPPGGYCFASLCDPSVEGSCGEFGFCSNGVCAARCQMQVGSPYAPCRWDPEAIDAYSCHPFIPGDATATTGICVRDCTLNPDSCASGQVCDRVAHTCVVDCAIVECPSATQACEAHVCRERFAACTVNSNCGRGTVCLLGRCAPAVYPCSMTRPCPINAPGELPIRCVKDPYDASHPTTLAERASHCYYSYARSVE